MSSKQVSFVKHSGPSLLSLLLLISTEPNFQLLSLTPTLQAGLLASPEHAMHSDASRHFCKLFLQPAMILFHHPFFPDPSKHRLLPMPSLILSSQNHLSCLCPSSAPCLPSCRMISFCRTIGARCLLSLLRELRSWDS